MLLNFLKSAYRNLVRNWIQSLIQILSLAIGLTVFTMIVLYLYDELTVDRSNENLHQVYRIENRGHFNGNQGAIRAQMGPVIQQQIPEIKYMTRISHSKGLFLTLLDTAGIPGKQVAISNNIMVDSGFFEIFPQEFLLGDPRSLFKDSYSIILTQSVAKKLFGFEDPLGKTVHLSNQTVREITGIIEDPLNTHFKFESIVPINWQGKGIDQQVTSGDSLRAWWQHRPTYIMLHENADTKAIEKKIEDTWMEFRTEQRPGYGYEDLEISLCPLKKVHFSDIDPWNSYMSIVEKKVLLNFFLLGVVILLLGIINYVNLTTARATRRSREIAIKKIVGSSRSKLILHFLMESVLTTLISFLIAVTCLQLLFPKFNQLLQAEINLYFLAYPLAWVITLVVILVIGIVAGIYPALLMSTGSLVPAQAGDAKSSGRGLIARRILMLIQFSSAVVLMIGILVMHLQIRYMKNRDLGFNAEQIVWVKLGQLTPEKKGLLLFSRFERYPEIQKACFSTIIPGKFLENPGLINSPGSIWHGMDLEIIWAADPEFFDVYGLNFTHGRDILDRKSLASLRGDISGSDEAGFYVINETCMKALDLDDPEGFKIGDNGYIVGVVEDFHFQSLLYPVRPLIIMIRTGYSPFLSMRINSPDISKTLGEVEKEIQEVRYMDYSSDYIPTPLQFNFLDETINQQYMQVQRVYDASAYFFVLAMLIACLGLFGLSTFMVQRRTKEIGIRKAMGSSERQVFIMLAKEFTKWVLLSLIIGCPIGWYVMKHWQQQFAYKAEIGIWVYIVSAFITLSTGILTVAWQSLKTARANPVDALRNE